MNPTQDQPMGDIESALEEMTVWRGDSPTPRPWESALSQSEHAPGTIGNRLTRMLHWNMPKALAASILLLVGIATLFAIGLERRKQPAVIGGTAGSIARSKQLGSAMATYGTEWNDRQLAPGADISHYSESSGLHSPAVTRDFYLDYAGVTPDEGGPRQAEPEAQDSGAAPAPSERMVVKKATIDLQAADVRGVFLKASHLISEASGEYVEQSSLTGEGPATQGNLTLRIAVDRLDRVMNELRELAHVHSENLAGDDVTAQVVDLEARLRNEQRVETELLELMQKRTDAPLEDILHLREEISRVRQRIEQIAAQQQRLSRLVSLATVLVIIRAEPTAPHDEEKQDKDQTLRQYFGSAVADAWSGGMRFLADTLAGLIGVLIGGIIWWTALLAALLVLRQHLRRRAGLV